MWCKWLGIDPLSSADEKLLAIADEAAHAKLPPSWSYHVCVFAYAV